MVMARRLGAARVDWVKWDMVGTAFGVDGLGGMLSGKVGWAFRLPENAVVQLVE